MRSLTFVALFLSALLAGAQNVALGVGGLQTDTNIDASAAKTLSMRLQKILAQNGITEYGSDFVVVPKVIITEDELIEGGMKNIYKIQADLILDVFQMSTNKSFGSTSVELKGSGVRTKAAALKNAFGSIKYSDTGISKFLSDSKNSIVKYYTDNKTAIFSKARAAAAQNDYEQAIAILGSIPEGMPYSAEVDRELVSVFAKWSKQNCESTILQAKAAIANKQFDEALSLLGSIDPGSVCSSQASQLMNSIKSEIRAADAQERADTRRREQMAADLVKTRINAARDVAKAYYQRTYPTYNVILY